MSGTVVDQFVVKYTLDTTGIAKGVKDVEDQLASLGHKAKSGGADFGEAIEAGAKRANSGLGMLGAMLGKGGVIGLAIGATVGLGMKLDDKLLSIAKTIRRLGIDSRTFDISASGLRNIQNASEMAGGSIEDATASVGGLKQALFNLKFNGQVSDSIVMLSRLGVQFQDSYGRARDFNDVMLDASSVLEKMQKSGRMTSGEASWTAQQAGFTGGMTQLVIGGRANLEAELAKQAARRQVNGGDLQASTRMGRASTSLAQAKTAEVGNALVGSTGNARAAANEGIESGGKYVIDALKDLGDAVENAASRIKTAWENTGPVTPSGGVKLPPEGIKNAIAAAAKTYDIPEAVLTGLLRTESGFDPTRVNPRTGAKGIAQLMPATAKALGVTAGEDTRQDIFAAAQLLNTLRDSGVGKGMDARTGMVYAVDAYHTGAGNLANHTNIGSESRGYASKVLAGTGLETVSRPWMDGTTASGHTEVTIGSVQVYSPSHDPTAHGNAVADTIKRKLLTANAEGGTQ